MSETIRLKVISEYRAGALYYAAGSTIDAPVETALWLMRDAPGCFELIVEAQPAKAFDGPPADKMVKAPGRKKR